MSPDLAFLNEINWQGFSPETSDVLRRARLKKVELIKSQAKWLIYMSFSRPIPRSELAHLESNLCTLVQGLKSVEVVPSYDDWQPTLEVLVKEHWELIEPELVKHLPALATVKYAAMGDTLYIYPKNEMNLQYLTTKGCIKLVSQYLSTTFGLDVRIQLEVDAAAQDNESIINQALATEQQLLAKVRLENPPSAAPKAQPKGGAIYGRAFNAEAIAIKEVQDEEKSIVVLGQVFGLEARILKSGRTLLTFNISDNSDSISVKIFEEENGTLAESGVLKDGMWVKVRGPVQYDKFSQELTVMARDIVGAVPTERMDDAEEKRVELHLHTKMSVMDGITSASQLIKRAAKWGHPAIAITDHGVVQAFPEAVEAAEKAGIKLIYGIEAYLVDDDPALGTPLEQRKSRHCILLAQNETGLYNLYRLITDSHLKYYHRTPRMPKSLVQANREGIIIGSACEAGELIRAYLDGAERETLVQIARFYDYLEI
ncbi:MAG TPA: PHP domain-containing protein, partial [Verrucomicrobiae bacterium]|nr:PHP domain-containing protein [Verrucomicrobiae bacterium]